MNFKGLQKTFELYILKFDYQLSKSVFNIITAYLLTVTKFKTAIFTLLLFFQKLNYGTIE